MAGFTPAIRVLAVSETIMPGTMAGHDKCELSVSV
jgi:hypothetical protein